MGTKKISHELKSFILHAKKHLPVKQIMLYGSYAKGTAHNDSDIDLVVVMKQKMVGKIYLDITDEANKIATKVKSPIPFHVYGVTQEEYISAKPWSLLGEVKKEGIEVYNANSPRA